jgi:GNAT superfamily N-acetyltransferase
VADPEPGAGRTRDEVTLADGSVLLVRPIRPGDAPALVALHERLSTDTIYRRYFGARPHLSPAVVERFTRVEEYWRFAFVALSETGDLVGVARYEGAEGSTAAELAMVVDDALQHHGVGRLLWERLVDVARERGMRTIVADVLTGNAPMLRLLRSSGLPLQLSHAEGVTTVTVDIVAVDATAVDATAVDATAVDRVEQAADAVRRNRARAHVAETVDGAAPAAAQR